MILALFLLVATLRVPDAAQFVGAPQGAPLAGETLAKRTDEVARLLRCPVCQGMSVADSPAAMAVNMKGQVRELLQRGYTEEQILQYFERSYGEFVLLRPKSAMVWILPLIALAIGVFVVVRNIKRLSAAAPAPAPAAPAEDPYLAQVRQLVGERTE